MSTRARHEVPDALRSVRIEPGFWARIVDRTRTVTLPHVLHECEAHGFLENFDLAAGVNEGAYNGESSVDSNVFKTLEGASYFVALSESTQPAETDLARTVSDLVHRIAAAQEDDGYLNTCFTVTAPDEKYKDLHRSHELYCFGHLIEAGVAHYEATGDRTLIDVCVRLADHVDQAFGPGRLELVPGHQELELALVRLADATGDSTYRDLARYFVDMRGDPVRVERDYKGKPVIESETHPGRNRPPSYRQDHLPAVDQRTPIGHGVRAGYFYAALAEIAMGFASIPHRQAAASLWDEIVARHLYLTGGIGTHQHRDEGFGDAYRLPNESAYCETCAGIALLLFTDRMRMMRGDSGPADLMELILFNHLLGSTDLGGRTTFYRNPLASDGTHRRKPWDDPACCITNVVRIIPQLPRYLYSQADQTITVDQFVPSRATMRVADVATELSLTTEYPWDGHIRIELHPQTSAEFTLRVRIPGWVRGRPAPGDLYRAVDAVPSDEIAIELNGTTFHPPESDGYAVLHRMWAPGDVVDITLPMHIRQVHADDRVEADRDRVALMRGPLVYVFEEIDVSDGLDSVVLGSSTRLVAERREDLLGGVTVVREESGAFAAVPYFTWGNRGDTPMAVWTKRASR